MRKVHSAGGIVIEHESVLMLRKANGDWVLPKGRIEGDETDSQAAVREVQEESGIQAEVVSRIGRINYQYCNIWYDNEMIDKFVSWFLMEERGGNLLPQREEGFVEAKYIRLDTFEDVAKYEDEKRMIRQALILLENR